MIGRLLFGAAILVTLPAAAQSGALSDGVDKAINPTASSMEHMPLPLTQALQLPGLQPQLPAYRVGTDGSYFQGLSIRRTPWTYEVHYRYTEHGWQFESYSVARIQDTNGGTPGGLVSPGDRQALPSVRAQYLNGGASGIDPGHTPPGPGHFDPGLPPGNPDDPGTHRSGPICGQYGGYDVNYDFLWIPEHDVYDDEGNFVRNVPGHWELQSYTAELAPADFCE